MSALAEWLLRLGRDIEEDRRLDCAMEFYLVQRYVIAQAIIAGDYYH